MTSLRTPPQASSCGHAAQDCKLNALTDMVQSYAGIVESTSRLGSDGPEDDTLHAVAALYQSRANSAAPSHL